MLGMFEFGKKLTVFFLVFLSSAALAQNSPKPKEIVSAVVSLRADIPENARTARSLGTERIGSGVVIDEADLVVTIGYLILEASAVEVTNAEGEFVPAKIIAYDNATGFGLVRAEQPLNIKPVTMGESAGVDDGDVVLVISNAGARPMTEAQVVDRRDFAGYWEYLLENAIFTAPPHPVFGGAALINKNGHLVGVGSLIVSDADDEATGQRGNMFVPIDALKFIMDELIAHGRTTMPRRPWLGIYTEMNKGHLFVTRIAQDSPASRAGVEVDDIVVSVAGTSVSSMADFFRKLWATGDAGADVVLSVLRGGEVMDMTLKSADRYQWLKLNPGGDAAKALQI